MNSSSAVNHKAKSCFNSNDNNSAIRPVASLVRETVDIIKLPVLYMNLSFVLKFVCDEPNGGVTNLNYSFKLSAGIVFTHMPTFRVCVCWGWGEVHHTVSSYFRVAFMLLIRALLRSICKVSRELLNPKTPTAKTGQNCSENV